MPDNREALALKTNDDIPMKGVAVQDYGHWLNFYWATSTANHIADMYISRQEGMEDPDRAVVQRPRVVANRGCQGEALKNKHR